MYDVVALGNAIVDVLAQKDESFLSARNISKGSMRLIDEVEALEISNALGEAKVISGGSAANTVVGVASFGGKAGFIGKVKSDDFGKLFKTDIEKAGVTFQTLASSNGAATARSMIIVTGDGERTMNTFLGAAQNLTEDDVDPTLIANAKITYLEGYLWDPPLAKKAFVKAADIAHKNKRQVALTLSDAFCVDRYRDEFLALMRDKTVDIVFANESEVKALYQTSDLETALKAFEQDVGLGVVTLGENGATALHKGSRVKVEAVKNVTVIDTTGAGDLFAAGFLAAFTQGKDLSVALTWGAKAAAEVISHIGARPLVSLKSLI